MLPHILVPWLVACTPSAETSPDGTADTSSGSDSGTPSPVAWTAQRACSAVRLFATAGDRGLAIELRAEVVAAVLDQDTLILDSDLATGPAVGIVQDGMREGDVCSSIEEFPPVQRDPHWKITSGTLHLEFTPAGGLGADDIDWTYDGTEVGTVHAELRDPILSPQSGAGAAELPDLDLDLPLTVPDLPA